MANNTTDETFLPKVTITYCTQCRWMLRAAYFAQELLSTFATSLGEVALRPATGGTFYVDLAFVPRVSGEGVVTEGSSQGGEVQGGEVKVQRVRIWDRKAEGGFPETKVLKQLVRDRIQPERDLGHSDVGGKKKVKEEDGAGKEAMSSSAAADEKESATPEKHDLQHGGAKQEGCEECT